MSKPKTKAAQATEPKATPSDRFRSAPYYDPIRKCRMVLTHLGAEPLSPLAQAIDIFNAVARSTAWAEHVSGAVHA